MKGCRGCRYGCPKWPFYGVFYGNIGVLVIAATTGRPISNASGRNHKMEIITRAQARERGLNKYFTGAPCRNGHLAERYTTSAACQLCLTESVAGVRRAVAGKLAPTPERLAQLEQLVPVRLRAHPADEATLLDTVAAVTLARCPLLVAMDVVGTRKGTKPEGGTLLYVVNVDPADVQILRDMQNAMLKARGPDINALRAAAFGGNMAIAEAARDNGEGEWCFK